MFFNHWSSGTHRSGIPERGGITRGHKVYGTGNNYKEANGENRPSCVDHLMIR